MWFLALECHKNNMQMSIDKLTWKSTSNNRQHWIALTIAEFSLQLFRDYVKSLSLALFLNPLKIRERECLCEVYVALWHFIQAKYHCLTGSVTCGCQRRLRNIARMMQLIILTSVFSVTLSTLFFYFRVYEMDANTCKIKKEKNCHNRCCSLHLNYEYVQQNNHERLQRSINGETSSYLFILDTFMSLSSLLLIICRVVWERKLCNYPSMCMCTFLLRLIIECFARSCVCVIQLEAKLCSLIWKQWVFIEHRDTAASVRLRLCERIA